LYVKAFLKSKKSCHYDFRNGPLWYATTLHCEESKKVWVRKKTRKAALSNLKGLTSQLPKALIPLPLTIPIENISFPNVDRSEKVEVGSHLFDLNINTMKIEGISFTSSVMTTPKTLSQIIKAISLPC